MELGFFPRESGGEHASGRGPGGACEELCGARSLRDVGFMDRPPDLSCHCGGLSPEDLQASLRALSNDGFETVARSIGGAGCCVLPGLHHRGLETSSEGDLLAGRFPEHSSTKGGAQVRPVEAQMGWVAVGFESQHSGLRLQGCDGLGELLGGSRHALHTQAPRYLVKGDVAAGRPVNDGGEELVALRKGDVLDLAGHALPAQRFPLDWPDL